MTTPPSSDGTGPSGEGTRAAVRRLDERLGLAVARAGLSPRSLVTYARDHVSVRTPSRPDFRDGNTIDLESTPAPGDLARWVERFTDTTGRLGVRHVQLRWETPLRPTAPADRPTLDRELADAAAALGFTVHPTTVLLLDELAAPAPAAAELAPVPAPSAVEGATPVEVERRWHAVQVLDRYASGDTPDDWRAADAAFTAWAVDVRRELVLAGRATVWLAQRHGAPVATTTVLHDRQGLAVVEDLVVHPAHRRLGLASALTHRAVAAHLAEHGDSRVGVGVEPGGPSDALHRRLGFAPHATVWTALRAPDAGGAT